MEDVDVREDPKPPVLDVEEEPKAEEEPKGEDIHVFSDHVDVWSIRDHAVDFRHVPGGALELSWPALDTDGGALRYLVVGSPSGVPVRPSAGTRLVLTDDARAQVPVGSGPFFAVFSYVSPEADDLVAVAPVHHASGRVVPEVADLRVSTHTDAIVLTWTTPSGVDRVRVMRGLERESLPAGFDAALEIPSYAGHARDTDVQPGRRYEYRVLTQSVSSNGDQSLSAGLEVIAEIPAVPEPVAALAAEVTGESPRARVELRWPTPPLGRVVVYQSSTVPEHAATNRVITTAQLDGLALGTRIGEPVADEGGTSSIAGLPFDVTHGARRAYTPVTLIGNQAAVGPATVVNLLGPVTELELTERVTWQLLRFAWPEGATFAFVERGSRVGPDGSPPTRVSRDEYERQGGLPLKLPKEGCELFVRGAVIYAGEWTTGPITPLTYPGRWVLRYRFEKVGLMGRRRSLQVHVDRPWRGVRLALTHRADRVPLHVYDSPETPSQVPVDGAVLPENEWVTIGEVPVRSDGYTRLFAHLQDAAPIVIDPPMTPRTPDAAPPALGVTAVRCVRCMTTQDHATQLFRCAGSCAPEPDPNRSAFLGQAVHLRPLFQVDDRRLPAAACPRCGTLSEDHVCRACHASLPPESAISDPVSMTVVGARGTGKTTYILSLLAFLQEVWGRANGASAAPLDSHSAGRLRQLQEPFEHGRTVGSTVRAEQNPEVLAPMVLRLDEHNGRQRTLALYDVAGEDVENRSAVRPYGPSLASTDAILFLLDPLQLPEVRNLLDGQIALPPRAGDPMVVMENVIAEIRQRTGRSRIDVPVAIALSKIDGIHRAVRTPGTNVTGLLNGGSTLMQDPTPAESLRLDASDRRQVHEETRSLLLTLGATQFVHLVENTFTRTEYFAVSALGHAPAGGTTLSAAGVSAFRVADPLRWLVDRRWPTRRR
ncbi:hypothetical protein ACI784_11090 [Geodermatophilus sp. SYSU D01186]